MGVGVSTARVGELEVEEGDGEEGGHNSSGDSYSSGRRGEKRVWGGKGGRKS